MNIIFLDFDGVMDTASYDMYLVRMVCRNAMRKGVRYSTQSASRI